MALDPSIALGVKPLEIANPLAQYGQIAAIQNAQNQNALAQYQLSAAQRADADQQMMRNALTGLKYGTPEYDAAINEAYTRTGNIKGLQELQKGKLETQKTQGEIDKNAFELGQKKLKQAWENAGAADSPEIAIEQINAAVKRGDVDMTTATQEIKKLQEMKQPQDYMAWRLKKLAGLLDAKDQLAGMLPKVTLQDIGGSIVSIQDNPMLPGYGKPVAGMNIGKTATIGERTAQGQLGLAQQKFDWEKANPGYELKEAEDGLFYGVNKRTLQAVPVTVGGGVPGAAPVAGAPAGQLKGKGTPMTESQSNATAFGMRMADAQKLLTDLEGQGVTSGGRIKGAIQGTLENVVPFAGEALGRGAGSVMNAMPGVLGGPNENQQSYEQAKENFITAVLRKESGASISPSEFNREEKKYFPQAGDTDKVIEQKRKARDLAIQAMKIQAGSGAKNIGSSGGEWSVVK